MERLIHSLKVFWRAERLLRSNEIELSIKKVMLSAGAGLVALFGLVMLSVAVFFALAPIWGEALAALFIASVDFILALLMIMWARSMKPATETKMVQEVREMALSDIELEIGLADAELTALKNEVQGFVRNPVDALLPSVIGPLVSGAAKGLKAKNTA